MKEIWKTAVVDGVENPRYKVSSHGRIICLKWGRTGKPRICRLSFNSYGYLQVGIDRVLKMVHRIVAETFIPNPEHKPFIDHINTIKTDNVVLLADDGKTILYTNLRWVTHKENDNNPLTRKHKSENHAKHWFGKLGDEHPSSISIVQLTLNGKFIKKWACGYEVQRELGIYQSSIVKCCRGEYKSAGGFKWMYYSDLVKKSKKPSDIKPLF